jgi:hypothetical protein
MDMTIFETLFSSLFIGNLFVATLILGRNLDKESFFQPHVDWKYYLMTAMWGGKEIYAYLPSTQSNWFRVCVYINALLIIAYILLKITTALMM